MGRSTRSDASFPSECPEALWQLQWRISGRARAIDQIPCRALVKMKPYILAAGSLALWLYLSLSETSSGWRLTENAVVQ
jgi:hypothetical protein